jgi:hypothetical protein
VFYPETVSAMVLLTIVFYTVLVLTLGREPVPESRSTV